MNPHQIIPEIDFTEKWSEMKTHYSSESIKNFADKLGVDILTLQLLECVWSNEHFAYCFPVKGKHEKIIGIRLINDIGQKWWVKGSKSGSFSVLGPIDSEIEKVIRIINFI